MVAVLTGCSVFKSQTDTKISYLDKEWSKTSKEKATYYREKRKVAKKHWEVKDYYMSGTVQMTGSFTSRRLKKRTGECLWYYESGQLKTQKQYSDGLIQDTVYKWYESGELRLKKSYNDLGKKEGLEEFWYKSGNINYSGINKNGEKDGVWKWYFENGVVSSKEIYENGKMISIEQWKEDGEKQTGELKAWKMPEFKYGNDSISSYIYKHFEVPSYELIGGAKGKAIARFTVDKTGMVTDVKIIQSVHPLIDKELIRVIKSMPKWKPGKSHNRPVKVLYSVPLNFN